MDQKLKKYNSTIIVVLLVNILGAFSKEIYQYISKIPSSYINISNMKLVYFLIAPIIIYILNGVFPANIKEKIVFLRIKNPLPGTRVFTKLIDKDARIDKDILIHHYNELPVEPEKQNSLWYRIYSNYKEDSMIFASHHNFLKGRDTSSCIFLYLITYVLVSIFIKEIAFSINYALLLFLEFNILALVTRNHGNRFVLNVLALDQSEKFNKENS